MLSIKDLCFGYSRKREILHGINCEINQKQFVTVLGPNGCGKTTFIKCINRILTPWSGTILLGDMNLRKCTYREIAKKIGYVPQLTTGGYRGTVIDFILLGRHEYLNWRLKESDLLAVMEILERLNIRELANSNLDELSGGQKQKVLVARALIRNPELYIFDEPTSNLDLKNQIELMELAREIVNQDKKTVIMVVHELNLALHYSDYVILLLEGRIIAHGRPNEVLSSRNIREVYGVETKVEACGFINPF